MEQVSYVDVLNPSYTKQVMDPLSPQYEPYILTLDGEEKYVWCQVRVLPIEGSNVTQGVDYGCWEYDHDPICEYDGKGWLDQR